MWNPELTFTLKNKFQTMKQTIIYILCLLALSGNVKAQIDIVIDEVHELNSIVWRLAGAQEYNQCAVTRYTIAIDSCFNKYKDHPLITYCMELRDTQFLGYDAIATVASFIEKDNDGIDFCHGYAPQSVADTDKRWTAESCQKYVELLDDFYRESHFETFFEQQQSLYQTVIDLYKETPIGQVDTEWFENEFGTPFPDLKIFVSVNNGASNYGCNTQYPDSRKGILIGMVYENNGQLHVADATNTIPIHEICHYFTNPLAKEYIGIISQRNIESFYHYFNNFAMLGIGLESIPYEWLTRLACIHYCKTHDRPDIPVEWRIGEEMRQGFIWMKRSYELLDSLSNNKTDSQYFKDFVPALIQQFNGFDKEINEIINEFETMNPRIADVYPQPGSEPDTSGQQLTFTVKFSDEMYECNNCQFLMRQPANIGRCGGCGLNWIDNKTLQITIPTDCAEDIGMYGLVFFKNMATNVYGFPLVGINTFMYEL